MSMTFTIADELRPGRRHIAQRRSGDPAKSTLRYMPFIFGGAFIYDPKSGKLSTVPEFGSVSLGNIGKHLSQHEVQDAIRELGRVIDEDLRSSEEGSPPPQTLLEGR
jgi:hypothetical protein